MNNTGGFNLKNNDIIEELPVIRRSFVEAKSGIKDLLHKMSRYSKDQEKTNRKLNGYGRKLRRIVTLNGGNEED